MYILGHLEFGFKFIVYLKRMHAIKFRTVFSDLSVSGKNMIRLFRNLAIIHSRISLMYKVKIFVLLVLSLAFSHIQAQEKQQSKILSVTEARKDANGDFMPDLLGKIVTIGGRANVYSGVIHTDRLVVFLEDEMNGIELYDTKFGPPIAEGDSVIATGVVEQFEGLTRISRITYRTVIVDRPKISPPTLEIKEANSEKYEGRVIRLEGEITNKWEDGYGSYLSLREHRDDKDSMIVFMLFRHKPGIDFGSLNLGDRIIIAGILGQFIRTGALNTGYELFPRYPEDIQVIGSPVRSYLIMFYIFGGVLFIVVLWILLLRRQVAKQTKKLQDSEDRFRSIFEGAMDVILVLKEDLKIESANPAACQLCGLKEEELITKSFTEVFHADPFPAIKTFSGSEHEKKSYEFESTLVNNATNKIQLLAKMNIFNLENSHRIVLVMRDITERKHAESERNELINKLTDALAELRTLGGLLPICSSCKKIRDDHGYWKQLEEYFYSHSDVRFTHGICPECSAKLFPNFNKKPEDT
jgi:PAS domain S-box-containing protein